MTIPGRITFFPVNGIPGREICSVGIGPTWVVARSY